MEFFFVYACKVIKAGNYSYVYVLNRLALINAVVINKVVSLFCSAVRKEATNCLSILLW